MGLKDLRVAKGLNQHEAAELFDLKYRTYQNYENGVTSPDMETAARLARYFHCTIGDLFDLTEGDRDLLSQDEHHLVDLYRGMNNDGKRALIATAQGLTQVFRTH